MNSGVKYCNIRDRHLDRVPAWLFFLSTVFIGNNFLHAQTDPHVLMVTEAKPTSPDGDVYRRDLVKVSKSGKEKITELTDFLIFGKDESSVAILDGHYQDQSNEWRKNDWDLWVIDRATSKLVAHTTLHDFHALPWIRDCMQKLAVQSQDSIVCAPLRYDRAPDRSEYGFANVNWKGEVRLDAKQYQQITDLWAAPAGFAFFCNDWKVGPHVVEPMVALYDAPAQKMRLVTTQSKGSNDWKGSQLASDQLVFVPTVGLVQYHHGALFLLSDASLKKEIPEPDRIPISKVDSQIFAYLLRGKPCLLWGENTIAPAIFDKISEIVIYDWNTKRELLRKSLPEATSSFQMNQSGSRLYFLDGGQEKICFLDIETGEIAMFSDIGPIAQPKSYAFTYSGKSLRTILDAY